MTPLCVLCTKRPGGTITSVIESSVMESTVTGVIDENV